MIPVRSTIRHLAADGETIYSLRDRLFSVGSSPDNDLVLSAYPDIPPIAVLIEPHDHGYRCSAAQKGTVTINGKKVRSAVLAQGDTISVGKVTLVYNCVSTEASTCNQDRLPEKLRHFIGAIGRERRLEPLFKNLLRILIELTGGSDVFIFKLGPDGKPEIFDSNLPGDADERFSDTIVQAVFERKEGVCIANALADPAYKHSHSISDLKLKSVLCAPMMSAGKCTGLIYVGSNNPAVSFTPVDLETVSVYAAIAAMLINHVDLITNQQSAINRLTGAMNAEGIVAASPAMRSVLDSVQAVADAEVTILLEGETGTGKNRIAELLHARSRRSAGPFLVVNCSALHDELLESELFGHRRGSFTGATSDHDGLFTAANGGTIVLDEIGELSTALQAKLLRTLENGTVRPLGSTQELKVDVRVICATNRDLGKMVDDGVFRADLYYRINQFSICMPPLREREDDVILLAYLFFEKFRFDCPSKLLTDFHPESIGYLRSHSWPGNVRELANVIRRAVLISPGPLVCFDLTGKEKSAVPVSFDAACRQYQKMLLEKALAAAGGNRENAARSLGLSRSTFYRYLGQLGL